jgi:hypothetical protein
MKKIVATTAVAFTVILASTAASAQVDNAPTAGSDGSSTAANALATRFSGQGAWVVVSAMGGQDAIAATERGGVVLAIMGLSAAAILARSKFRAEEEAQRARQMIRRASDWF